MYEKLSSFNEAYDEFELEHNRPPSIKELSKITGETEQTVYSLMNHRKSIISMDAPVGDEEDTEFINFIPDDTNIIESYEKKELKNELLILFKEANLKQREIDVLKLRFGLDNGKSRTLEEVGKIFGVTRERIRQIEASGLRKLGHVKKSKGLAIYTNNPTSSEEIIDENIKEYYKKRRQNKKPRIEPEIKTVQTKESEVVKQDSEKSDKSIEKINNNKEEIKMKKLPTIFEYLSNYSNSKEHILEGINQLDDDEKNLVYKRYGGDLDNPKRMKLTSAEKTRFYQVIIPKLKKYLTTGYMKKTRKYNKKANNNLSELDNYQNQEEPQIDIKQENTTLQQLDTQKNEVLKSQELKVSTNELIEFFNSPFFINLQNQLGKKDALLIALVMKYPIEFIADFMNLEENKVRKMTQKALSRYKAIINLRIDSFIEQLDPKETENDKRQYKKK